VVSELAPVVIGRGEYTSVQTQDRFPIKDVGNDAHGDGNGCPINDVGYTDEERSFFSRNGHNMEVIGHKAISRNFDIVTIALVEHKRREGYGGGFGMGKGLGLLYFPETSSASKGWSF
jgi:hypothetical protein